jgi:HEPN domain-containing protein
MPKRRITLLQRAEGDLEVVRNLLPVSSDEVLIDICAYHCQQCVEKVAKFLILLEGKEYSIDHRSDHYLQDLDDTEAKELINTISHKIDSWATYIRYSKTALSNKITVTEVFAVCEKLVKLAHSRVPTTVNESDNIITLIANE